MCRWKQQRKKKRETSEEEEERKEVEGREGTKPQYLASLPFYHVVFLMPFGVLGCVFGSVTGCLECVWMLFKYFRCYLDIPGCLDIPGVFHVRCF